MNMEVQPNVGRIPVVPSKPPQIRSYAELRVQLHRDLLAQHPEWIDSNGNSPIVDGYDQRLAKLISDFESANQKHTSRRAIFPMANPVLLLSGIAGGRSCTPGLNALREAGGNDVTSLGYPITYAIANVLLTVWGPVVVAFVHAWRH